MSKAVRSTMLSPCWMFPQFVLPKTFMWEIILLLESNRELSSDYTVRNELEHQLCPCKFQRIPFCRQSLRCLIRVTKETQVIRHELVQLKWIFSWLKTEHAHFREKCSIKVNDGYRIFMHCKKTIRQENSLTFSLTFLTLAEKSVTILRMLFVSAKSLQI